MSLLHRDYLTDQDRVELVKAREDALAWVNEIRAKHDLPAIDALLPGRRRNARSCPLANSLAVGNGRASVTPFDGAELDHRLHDVSTAAENFMACFDVGFFPDLEVDE